MATLELKQVRTNYGYLEVIHGIDLFIKNGELIRRKFFYKQ